MAKIIFLTGGAASGKSRWATTYFEACDNVLYLCTAPNLDHDILRRIEYNNKRHGVEWELHTSIRSTEMLSLLKGHKFFIFDNLGGYISGRINELVPDGADITPEMKTSIEKSVIDEISALMDGVRAIEGTLIIASIETGFSVCPESRQQMLFREIIGTINQRIANLSTEVYLSASGIQFKIKG